MENELGESELGTLEYWDERYKEEIANFRTHGDVGEVWFGEDIVDRLIKWMNQNVSNKDSKIVDLGCGNGMLSIELFKEAYTNVIGVDYSEDAINLAREVASAEDCNISFTKADILSEANEGQLLDVDVLLDKGTYDAISLSTDSHINRQLYIDNVYKFMKPDGRLVLTSCNWTKEELCEQFEKCFECVEIIPTPQFKFGGKVGNLVSSVVFKKK